MSFSNHSPTRRELLLGTAALLGPAALSSRAFAARAAADLRIDAARLQQTLEALSVHGRPAGGTFADGVSRVAYSAADVAGRGYAMELMRDARLQPRIDTAGNIFGWRDGSDRSLKPILVGSHIDSVPNGGNFDGDLGSLSAIEIVRTLNASACHNAASSSGRHLVQRGRWDRRQPFQPSAPLARQTSSAASAASRCPTECARLAAIRHGWPRHALPLGAFHCYLELHIEQGGTLDKAGVAIGVVEGIVSLDQ